MDPVEQLKQEIKECNKIAVNWQNQLHDLAEGLPNNLERLMETAKQTYEAFSVVAEKRERLKQLKNV